MPDGKLCDHCAFAQDHRVVKHSHGQYTKVTCTAPVPGWVDRWGDEHLDVGHKAAERCDVYRPVGGASGG